MVKKLVYIKKNALQCSDQPQKLDDDVIVEEEEDGEYFCSM